MARGLFTAKGRRHRKARLAEDPPGATHGRCGTQSGSWIYWLAEVYCTFIVPTIPAGVWPGKEHTNG
jgi:hypothetical protein